MSSGDGYCNDENNNEACFFDGGDCCSRHGIDRSNCTECECLEDNKLGAALNAKILYKYVQSKQNAEFNFLGIARVAREGIVPSSLSAGDKLEINCRSCHIDHC